MISLIKPSGLSQTIKNTTRYSRDKDSILDVFITNSNNIYDVGVCDINISDHQMILMTKGKSKTIPKKCTFTGRSYRNYNKNDFQASLVNGYWDEFDRSNDVTEKWEIHD